MVIPFARLATQQTRVLLATLRDGGDLGALLCRKPFVVALQYCASCFAEGIPNRPRRRREIGVNTP